MKFLYALYDCSPAVLRMQPWLCRVWLSYHSGILLYTAQCAPFQPSSSFCTCCRRAVPCRYRHPPVLVIQRKSVRQDGMTIGFIDFIFGYLAAWDRVSWNGDSFTGLHSNRLIFVGSQKGVIGNSIGLDGFCRRHWLCRAYNGLDCLQVRKLGGLMKGRLPSFLSFSALSVHCLELRSAVAQMTGSRLDYDYYLTPSSTVELSGLAQRLYTSTSPRPTGTTNVWTLGLRRWQVTIFAVTKVDQLFRGVFCDGLTLSEYMVFVQTDTAVRYVILRWFCRVGRRGLTRLSCARLPRCHGMHSLRCIEATIFQRSELSSVIWSQ